MNVVTEKLSGAHSVSNAPWAPWISSISVSRRQKRKKKVEGSASGLCSQRAPKRGLAQIKRLSCRFSPQIHLKPAFHKAFYSKEHNQKLQLIHTQFVNKKRYLDHKEHFGCVATTLCLFVYVFSNSFSYFLLSTARAKHSETCTKIQKICQNQHE